MEKERISRSRTQMVYGDAMQQAVATGDLVEMKKVAAQAEQHLKDHGNVSVALELLKIEIAKAEAKVK